MTNSQKSVKIGPDGADFFCDNSMNHEKKKKLKISSSSEAIFMVKLDF